MQLKSFTGFAPTPNLGGSFASGAGVGQKIGEAAIELKLGRERIAAQLAQAGMEAASKRQAIQAQALRAQQEAEIQKAYQEQQLGLKQQELDQAQALIDFKIQEAAKSFQASQMYQNEAAQMIQGGVDPQEAYSQSAMKFGPQMGLPGSAYSEMMKSKDGGFEPGSAAEVPGLPGWKRAQTSQNSYQYFPPAKTVEGDTDVRDIPGLPGKAEYKGRVYNKQEPAEVKSMRKKLERLEKAHEDDTGGAMAVSKLEQNPQEKLGKALQMRLDAYQKRQQQIDDLIIKIEEGSQSEDVSDKEPAARDFPFEEGKRVRNRRTGKMGIVRDGEIVEIDEEQE